MLSLPAECRAAPDAFSLIELLAVIAVFAVLAVLAGPALNSIGQGKRVTEAADQVAAAIEMARAEAVGRQTHVWVAFQSGTNAGSLELRVGMVASKDGTTNLAAANLQPLSRPLLIQRVGIAKWSELGLPSNAPTSAVLDMSGQSGGADFTIGPIRFDSRRTLTFLPTGEVTVGAAPSVTDGFNPLLGIGLRGTRGTVFVPNANNDIGVVVDGSVGVPRIYRR